MLRIRHIPVSGYFIRARAPALPRNRLNRPPNACAQFPSCLVVGKRTNGLAFVLEQRTYVREMPVVAQRYDSTWGFLRIVGAGGNNSPTSGKAWVCSKSRRNLSTCLRFPYMNLQDPYRDGSETSRATQSSLIFSLARSPPQKYDVKVSRYPDSMYFYGAAHRRLVICYADWILSLYPSFNPYLRSLITYPLENSIHVIPSVIPHRMHGTGASSCVYLHVHGVVPSV